MRHVTGSMAVLLLVSTTSPILYGQDLGYQSPISSWAEQLKSAFFPGFQSSAENIPGTALMASTPQRSVFEDDFVTVQGSRGNVETPVGNVFNLRF